MKSNVLVVLIVFFACVLLAVGDCAVLAQTDQPLRLMRRPDIHEGRIVFMYQNDLWLVPEEGGTARRITTHLGVEDYPKFSPDGKWIAFSGDYNTSNGAVFVIPSEGGQPLQLTYDGSNGKPVTWTRDGKEVIFASRRESFSRFFTKLFRVPAGGGIPVEIDMGMASFASFSPDGEKIVYNRHPSLFWWWKRYKGSMNQDVWIHDLGSEDYEKITDYEGNDSWPMWKGSEIYFVSDRTGGVSNVFAYDLDGKKIRQITSFKEHGVTWPSMSADGERIVFEREARLYVLDTESDKVREVVVRAPVNDQINMISYINPLEYVRSFDISPTAKRIVFEARGEVYTAPAEHGDVRNLTESSGARDSSPAWSPDGKWIAYVSDKSGDDEIYLIDQMGKEEERKLTSSGHFKGGVLWSPNSDKLVFTSDDYSLYLIDVERGSTKLIAKNEHRDIASYSWSPDGKWVAYDFARRNRNRDVFVYEVDKGESHQITADLCDDFEPTFTPDGKYLLLVTDRASSVPLLARLSLQPEEELPFEFKDDEETGVTDENEDEENDENGAAEEEETGKARGKKEGKDKKEKKTEKIDVKIDFTDIEKRIRRVPKTFPNPKNIQATERYYYYMIQPRRIPFFGPSYDLYAFDTKEMKSEKMLSGIISYGICANRKKLVYYDGDFRIIKVGKKAGAKSSDSESGNKKTSGKLEIKSKTKMRLDRREEWQQIFDEGWRVVKYYFYDPNLHGVDWDAVKKYYEGLLPYVRTRDELNLLMTEMVGELNASHQGVSRGDLGFEIERTSVASLGARLVLDEKSGYVRFDKIYRGDNVSYRDRSPLDADYVKIKEGDYLLAINGRSLEPNENFYRYLVDKTHNKITITTNDKATLKGATETKLDPLVNDSRLRYMDWVYGNEKLVNERSKEKIGYTHLPDMMGAGWREFQESFEKFKYKDGVIIDVRFNGGGNIDERIIDYLERRPYQITKTRDESVMERPREGYYGDIVVLINEFSFSDAEVFPSAVKERGLGTLIGVPTLGYVIAVSSHRLIDGGTIRKTHTGIWELSTGKQLESHGVEPDILVESPPEMEVAGRDVQLERAVEFLMEKIGERKDKRKYETPVDRR